MGQLDPLRRGVRSAEDIAGFVRKVLGEVGLYTLNPVVDP
jgi:hypothetical protein